jgi:uncharacterized protein
VRALRFALLTLLVTASLRAQPAPPPPPTRWVTDNVGFLSPSTRNALDARLATYQRTTGHQVFVWVGTSTAGEPLEPWCERAFAAWRIGRRAIDDGVVIFFFAQDRTVRIEVGYGLESVATDAATSRILRESVIPKLRANDRDGAVTASVNGVLALTGGERNAVAEPRAAPASLAQKVVMVFAGLLLVLLVIRYPQLAFLIFAMMRMGRGGDGGGVSGGGGRSGGGGSSGSW